MTKRLFGVTCILVFMIAMMFAIIFTFTPNEAHADPETYTITWKNGDTTLEIDENV